MELLSSPPSFTWPAPVKQISPFLLAFGFDPNRPLDPLPKEIRLPIFDFLITEPGVIDTTDLVPKWFQETRRAN
jgi:hypothetical protein